MMNYLKKIACILLLINGLSVYGGGPDDWGHPVTVRCLLALGGLLMNFGGGGQPDGDDDDGDQNAVFLPSIDSLRNTIVNRNNEWLNAAARGDLATLERLYADFLEHCDQGALHLEMHGRNSFLDCANHAGNTALHLAVQGGHVVVVKWLLSIRVGMTYNHHRQTALDLVRGIIAHNPDNNYRQVEWMIINDLNRQLKEALNNNQLFLAETFVSLGADVNGTLTQALNSKNLSMARYLISLGADANAGLKQVLNSKNLLVARFLISLGADINTVDDNGETVLHLAVSQQVDQEVLHLLVKEMIKANYQGEIPFHALELFSEETRHIILSHRLGATVYRNDFNEVFALLNNGVELTDEVLNMIIAKKDVAAFKKALGYYRGENFENLLKDVVNHGVVEMLQICFDCHEGIKAYILEHKDHLLFEATKNCKIEIVHFLLMQGADCNRMFKNNYNALYYAVENRTLEILGLFLHYGGNVNVEVMKKAEKPLFFCVSTNNNLPGFLLLLGAGCDITQFNSNTNLVRRIMTEYLVFFNQYGRAKRNCQNGQDPLMNCNGFVNKIMALFIKNDADLLLAKAIAQYAIIGLERFRDEVLPVIQSSFNQEQTPTHVSSMQILENAIERLRAVLGEHSSGSRKSARKIVAIEENAEL